MALSWQGDISGRSERNTSGVNMPVRVTQRLKVTPFYPANTNSMEPRQASITCQKYSREVERVERWEVSDSPQGDLSQNWGGTETKRAVTCMMLKGASKDKQSSPLT
ncbi:hypothetical protein TNCV_902281 [Trichonephila clavipes]|nr:hypothetical protein TNCV_902281 [Trichonephila clavipes]